MKPFSRFKRIAANISNLLVMNQRNLEYIYPNNKREHFPLADNKLQTKEILEAAGVPTPKTLFAYRYFFDLRSLRSDLEKYSDFVIKPARGRAGGGIVVIKGYESGKWISAGGRAYTLTDLRKHISDIIFGVYSFSLNDQAIIETRVEQHAEMNAFSPYGLCDIRVIMFRNKAVMAMLRVPTVASDGKANLHQGAIGVGLDMASGRTSHAIFASEPVRKHPDSGRDVIGFQIPDWRKILDICDTTARSVPLKYLGIDIAVAQAGPVVLEINVRPGIEIQNANASGMVPFLNEI